MAAWTRTWKADPTRPARPDILSRNKCNHTIITTTHNWSRAARAITTYCQDNNLHFNLHFLTTSQFNIKTPLPNLEQTYCQGHSNLRISSTTIRHPTPTRRRC